MLMPSAYIAYCSKIILYIHYTIYYIVYILYCIHIILLYWRYEKYNTTLFPILSTFDGSVTLILLVIPGCRGYGLSGEWELYTPRLGSQELFGWFQRVWLWSKGRWLWTFQVRAGGIILWMSTDLLYVYGFSSFP